MVCRSCSVTILVLVWWLCLGIVIAGRPTNSLAVTNSIASFKQSIDDFVSQTKVDPNSMSKRRVPHGPDPIHNRRAGKSAHPPGRA